VFVEVKYRKNASFGFAENMVSESQAERILEAAAHYQYEHSWAGPIRFDILSITGEEMMHFKDAFH
jgi:putative endonuclease